MKLTKLARQEMAMIGYSVAKTDDMGMYDNIISAVGEKLEIAAVYGEGYDTTVWRICGWMLGYDEPDVPDLNARICEALYNIGVGDDRVWEALNNENYEAAMALLREAGTHDAHGAVDTIATILTQHKRKETFV